MTIKDVETAVCAYFRIPPDRLHRYGQHREIWGITRPRQIVMFLARDVSETPYPRLGRYYRKHHTTAMLGVRRIRMLVRDNPKVAEHVAACRALLPSMAVKKATDRHHAELLKQGHVSWVAGTKPLLAPAALTG